jgi:hypothetical protein
MGRFGAPVSPCKGIPQMNSLLKKYGTRTISLLIRKLAQDTESAALANEMADDLQKALEHFSQVRPR